MDIAIGAMGTLLPKLVELVVGEYKLHKGVRGEIKELEEELTSMTAALHKVAEVPPDQLDEQVKIWARDVRELSYDIEDEVDTFMLHDKGHEHSRPFNLKGLIGRAMDLYKWAKTNHRIHNVIKDIMDQVKMVNERRKRYKVDNIAVTVQAMVLVDPRLEAIYTKATELVGIGGPKNELAKRLLEQDRSSPSSRQQSNIISIVGFGGLGKTTLANSLLQDLKAKFDCHIFVSVSLNPDIKKILKNILLQLDDKRYGHIDETWEMKLVIDKIVEFLKNKRYNFNFNYTYSSPHHG
jgi:chromosomal replication initiation ATPase DnaA